MPETVVWQTSDTSASDRHMLSEAREGAEDIGSSAKSKSESNGIVSGSVESWFHLTYNTYRLY